MRNNLLVIRKISAILSAAFLLNTMELLTNIIDWANGILWTYLLVAMLIGCALWFTFRCKLVQLTMLRDLPVMFRNCTHEEREEGVERISSFQAFAISIASRVGTGNLAGVAVAIVLGGLGVCGNVALLVVLLKRKK